MKKSFYFGLGLFLICYFLALFPDILPSNLSPLALKMLGVTLLMATFWLFETIPIPATSIIPLFALPFLGISTSAQVASAYASNIVLLFMSGFFIASAIEKWGLHKRISLHIIRIIGQKPDRLILGFMVATAVISLWISNTATALMMLPIASATIAGFNLIDRERDNKILGTGLMLAIAYGANIGGIGTPIGSPPNLIFLAVLQESFPNLPEISFLQWMSFGIPLVILFLGLTWFYLVKINLRITQNNNASDRNINVIDERLKQLGKMSRGELLVAILFGATVFLWITRADINIGDFTIRGWASIFGLSKYVKDTAVAAAIAVIMFVIPAQTKEGDRTYLLDWETAASIPWGILLLFGGGIAISKGFVASGLSDFTSSSLQANLQNLPIVLIIVAICIFMTLLTEITSNTAVTTLMMPILASVSLAMDLNPVILMWPAALSASCAFCLPVATPPNAIVYSQKYFSISTMARVGLTINIIGVILISLGVNFLVLPILN
ncbi:MAG: SLC13 family permease [Prochloraceae cyanobacterium]|nr:SLC13 family permease [Prochloraceae cyanobacterium]